MPLTFFDLDEINTLAAESPELYGGQYDLSPETVLLFSALLMDAVERWRWRASGSKLNDTQWDEAEAMVDQAVFELTKEPEASIPVWVEYGTLISYANGVYTIEPEYDGQGWYAKIWLNHDGVDFVDADTHYLTTDAQNYIPDPPTEEIYIYDRSDNVLYSGLHVTDYGHALLGAVDFWSTTQTFTALVTLGDVWP